MAAIQFVGMPVVLPNTIVKYGYIPKLDGGNAWYVQFKNHTDGEEVVVATPDRKSAKYLADVLVDYFKGGG